MTNLKYKLTADNKMVNGISVSRIQALIDFDDVKAGDLGGYIEDESNLSHEGNCWIYNDACALADSVIYDNAKIYDNVLIMKDVYLFDNAEIRNNVKLYDGVWVYDNAKVTGNASLSGNVNVYGVSVVCDDVVLKGNIIICGNSTVNNNSQLFNNVLVNNGTVGIDSIVTSEKMSLTVIDNIIVTDQILVS